MGRVTVMFKHSFLCNISRAIPKTTDLFIKNTSSGYDLCPAEVFHPQSMEQVKEILWYCSKKSFEYGLIKGHCHHLNHQRIHDDLIIDLNTLDKIKGINNDVLQHQPGCLTSQIYQYINQKRIRSTIPLSALLNDYFFIEKRLLQDFALKNSPELETKLKTKSLDSRWFGIGLHSFADIYNSLESLLLLRDELGSLVNSFMIVSKSTLQSLDDKIIVEKSINLDVNGYGKQLSNYDWVLIIEINYSINTFKLVENIIIQRLGDIYEGDRLLSRVSRKLNQWALGKRKKTKDIFNIRRDHEILKISVDADPNSLLFAYHKIFSAFCHDNFEKHLTLDLLTDGLSYFTLKVFFTNEQQRRKILNNYVKIMNEISLKQSI